MPNHLSTWTEIENSKLAFLPIGSTEQHGPHMPVCTDTLIATALAEELAKRFYDSYVLPPIPFSSSFEHAGFPGSVSLRVSTISAVISDILYSLELSGIKKCVMITGHMGNHLLRNITQELNVVSPRILLIPSAKHWQNAYTNVGLKTTTSADMHAGEGEASIIMSINPDYVRMNEIVDQDHPKRPLLEVLGMKGYTELGHIGFPSYASVEKGKALLAALVDDLSGIVKEFVDIG